MWIGKIYLVIFDHLLDVNVDFCEVNELLKILESLICNYLNMENYSNFGKS